MAESTRSLEFTPTWAQASVSTAFVLISFALERRLHSLGVYLLKADKKPLLAALQTMKDELMLVGFISIMFTVLRHPVAKICVSSSLWDKWTPCDISMLPNSTTTNSTSTTIGRRLLAEDPPNHCKEGHEPFLSVNGIDQLHLFIFVLAAVHVLYSCFTMILAVCKVHTWVKWEKEAHDAANVEINAEEHVKNMTRQSTFQRYHTSRPWSRSKFLVWVICFFQQLHTPRYDYLTLRLCFVTTHKLQDNFDFHSYMIRCLEGEFETIVGISGWLWGFVIGGWLFNVSGYNVYFWASFFPIIVILAMGTKLTHIVATLALENGGPDAGPFVGAMLKPRDELFWFHRPKILLYVIHLVLFQNALELATLLWDVWQFGRKSCLLDNKAFVFTRLAIGFAMQFFCSFCILPLYALVSQMGTNPKKAFISEHVGGALQNGHKDAQRGLTHEATTLGSPVSKSSGQDRDEHDLTDFAPLNSTYSGSTEANKDECVPLKDTQDDSPPRRDTTGMEDDIFRPSNVERLKTQTDSTTEIKQRPGRSISLPVRNAKESPKWWQPSLGRRTMHLETAGEQLAGSPTVAAGSVVHPMTPTELRRRVTSADIEAPLPPGQHYRPPQLVTPLGSPLPTMQHEHQQLPR